MKYQLLYFKYYIKLSMAIFLSIIFINKIQATTINVYNTGKIGDAIDIANNGDLILVYSGTYQGEGNRNLSFGGKNIEIRSVYGSSQTIIDCGGAPNRAFKLVNRETSASKIIGFTIKNGDVSNRYENGIPDRDGGLIFTSSSPVIENCIFEEGIALQGGAIAIFNSGTTISAPLINNCSFSNNSSTIHGGAINCAKNAHPNITSCTFTDNTSGHGGGILVGNVPNINVNISSSLFYENTASGNGGAIMISGNATISTSTIVKNTASFGSGISVTDTAHLIFQRNIVAFNLNEGIRSNNINDTIDFECNDFWQNNNGNFAGFIDSIVIDVNSIYEDPLFCDVENNDFYISSYSPCDEDSSKCGFLIGKYDDNCNYCCNLAGDVNNDDGINISDLVYLVAFMFQEGSPPPCLDEGDVNGSGQINISDLVYLIDFMFGVPAGSAPVCS